MLKEPTDEILERIADAGWDYNKNTVHHGVCIHERHTINATNHVYSGTVEHEDVSYGFQIESGDNNGTVVIEWGLEDDVGTFDPGPPPEPRTFLPNDQFLSDHRPEMFDVYCHWRNTPWFKEKQGAYNYDRHFQPGSKIETHYRDWAATKGMRIGYLSDLSDKDQKRVKELAK